MNQYSDLWTENELSDYLKLSKRTIQGFRHNKEGPPYLKIGRSVRYSPTQVISWMKKMEIK